MTLYVLCLLAPSAFAGQKAVVPALGGAIAPAPVLSAPTLNQTLSIPMPEFVKMDGAQSVQAAEADFNRRAQLGETIKPQGVEPVAGGEGGGARPLSPAVAQTPGPAAKIPAPKTAAVKPSGLSAVIKAIATPVINLYKYIFTTPERVPFTPTPGRHYYHGTSWADVMDIVAKDGALAPKLTYLARAHHQSEPYGDARARKMKSKTIVLEFEDEPVDSLNSFSGAPVGAYPAYRAHSPIPLSALTVASKNAVLDEYDRQGGSVEGRAALRRVLGL